MLRGLPLQVVRGRSAFDALRDELETVYAEHGVPRTSGLAYQRAWLAARRDVEPLLVVVREPGPPLGAAAGAVRGVVALATRRSRWGLTSLALLGDGADLGALPLPPDSADDVAVALGALIRGLPGPWALSLRQLPVGDPLLGRLASRLPLCAVRTGAPLLSAMVAPGAAPGAVLNGVWRKHERAALRRCSEAGLEVTVEHLREHHEVAAVLPALADLRRARDHALVRVSDLDDPALARLHTEAVLAWAADGVLDVTLLRLGGGLAGYVIGVEDGDVYRMWDGRISPGYADVWPGRVLFGALITELVTSGRWREIDGMRGSTDFKRKWARTECPTQDLSAWSSPMVRCVVEAPGAVHARRHALGARHPGALAAWHGVKRRRLPAAGAARPRDPQELVAAPGRPSAR